jgi:hypothetical protein
MPWCEECSRFCSPDSMGPAGECPSCGRPVAAAEATEQAHTPWHFKLLLVATVLYLGYRAFQGVAWLVGHG